MSTQSPSLRLKPSCVPHPTLKSQRYPLISAILQARIILQNQNQKLFLWPNNFSLFSCDQAALWTVLSIRPSVCLLSEFVGLYAVIIITDLRLMSCIGHTVVLYGMKFWKILIQIPLWFHWINCYVMIMWKYSLFLRCRSDQGFIMWLLLVIEHPYKCLSSWLVIKHICNLHRFST